MGRLAALFAYSDDWRGMRRRCGLSYAQMMDEGLSASAQKRAAVGSRQQQPSRDAVGTQFAQFHGRLTRGAASHEPQAANESEDFVCRLGMLKVCARYVTGWWGSVERICAML